MSRTPKYCSADTQCFERIDYRHVAVVELFVSFARVSLFEFWRITAIRKDLEKPYGAESSFAPEGIPQLK
ncbi:unnamed protein product [Echinostoma caproni]|uniref:Uncharacterized protein n=1 Tax=Echinostoma caproni TaxID=27848 RepID=A0A183A1V9_9TREM|nr:unnamed protein product [Echinostoma caproni]